MCVGFQHKQPSLSRVIHAELFAIKLVLCEHFLGCWFVQMRIKLLQANFSKRISNPNLSTLLDTKQREICKKSVILNVKVTRFTKMRCYIFIAKILPKKKSKLSILNYYSLIQKLHFRMKYSDMQLNTQSSSYNYQFYHYICRENVFKKFKSS